jgi:AcrR family transcriptional regulator
VNGRGARRPAKASTANGRRSRDDVVRAAGRLFAERGFHGTSMRDLGDALGLHGSSLYAHIGSKNELLEEIVSTGVQHCLALADEVLASDDAPGDKLRRLIIGHVELVVANLDTWATFVNEYRFLPDVQRERVVELRDRYEGAFRAVLKEAAADGSAREGLDERVVATLVLSQLNALPGWFRPGGRQSARQLGETIYELAMLGIGA